MPRPAPPGFVRRVSGLVAPPDRRTDRPLWVRPLAFAAPGPLLAERSGGTARGTTHGGPGTAGLPALPATRRTTVPVPIARLRRIHHAHCQISGGRESSVLKPGTSAGKRK